MEAGPIGVREVTCSQSFRPRGTRGWAKSGVANRKTGPLLAKDMAGGGRITRPDCLRTTTNGIIFKAPDLIHRMPRPARLGSR